MLPGEKAGGGKTKLFCLGGSRDPQKTAENLYSLSTIANTVSLQVFWGARKRTQRTHFFPPDFLWGAGAGKGKRAGEGLFPWETREPRGLILGAAPYYLHLPRVLRPVPTASSPGKRVCRGVLSSGCAQPPTPPALPQPLPLGNAGGVDSRQLCGATRAHVDRDKGPFMRPRPCR
jgi:hypothetical protein